ncbi:hypothetical protein G5I_04940 [Acromyrmex echinatior]|uniref:Uncharacterized protein n=1 Tax=Acromyrmex echinatior TaxID=103372 RepID=F4WGY8_ACREC|nr:hypothetical protein G5I_04940 [Acromyrmex echinatior]
MLEPPAGARKSARFTIATSPRTGPETSGQNTSWAVAAPRRAAPRRLYLRGAEATVAYSDTLFAHLFLMDAEHGNCTSGWISLQSGFSKFKESNDGMYSEA